MLFEESCSDKKSTLSKMRQSQLLSSLFLDLGENANAVAIFFHSPQIYLLQLFSSVLWSQTVSFTADTSKFNYGLTFSRVQK